MYSKEELNQMKLEDSEHIKAQEEYERTREIQRKRIVTHLYKLDYEFRTAKGFPSPNPTAGGQGVLNYTSQGDIPSYDLRHVKYIRAYKDDLVIFVSMQPLEQDSNSYNYHNLIYHIGVRVYKESESKEDIAHNNYFNMKLTGISLPMTPSKLSELGDFIHNEVSKAK